MIVPALAIFTMSIAGKTRMNHRASDKIGIVWYKCTDLRLRDNEPLFAAHNDCANVEHVFCIDQRWLGETKFGFPENEIASIASAISATDVFCHSEVCSEEKLVEENLARNLCESAQLNTYDGNYLYKINDLPFLYPNEVPEIFTQFRKAVEKNGVIRQPFDIPNFKPITEYPADSPSIPTLTELGIIEPPLDPRAVLAFKGGETSALQRIQQWVWDKDRLKNYKETRNGMIGEAYSSKLSPWLAYGCISPRWIYREVKTYESQRVANESTYWLIFELLWRDFFRFSAAKYGNRIFFLGGSQGDSKRKKWAYNRQMVEAWKEGTTGYPFIDSNMRELKLTGFMSNRGRQNVASFFVNDMGQDWRYGAEWFEEMLVDYDPCSNWGNWNYAAGVGADPREDRYFNIIKQAKSYDSGAEYIKRWCPELNHLSPNLLHDAPPSGLAPLKSSGRELIRPICMLKYRNYSGLRANESIGKSGGYRSKPKEISGKWKMNPRKGG